MRIAFAEFLSRILTKARRKYRFTGIVIGRVGFGFIWPATKGEAAPANQPELPLSDVNANV